MQFFEWDLLNPLFYPKFPNAYTQLFNLLHDLHSTLMVMLEMLSESEGKFVEFFILDIICFVIFCGGSAST